MVQRPQELTRISEAFRTHPIVALLSPRQCGKTTLARVRAGLEPTTYFDLENPVDARRLSAPLRALESLAGLVIIDEVQRQPAVLDLLRVLVDRPGNPARFLVLGSASPQLIKGASESLAGRIGFVDLSGFAFWEVGSAQVDRLWVRGGFPRSFLAENDRQSMAWRDSFVRTFLERDVPQLGISIPAETLRRFWTMIAHYHGQVWNAAAVARSLGASENTARRYLEILSGAYMVRVLPPWFENVRKRQVRAPKVYLRDTGILHALLQLATIDDVRGHPKLGASWEGFALEHVVRALDTRDAYFWATHAGAELDLMVIAGGKRVGFEFKYADAPAATRSMRVAVGDLDLEHLWVLYPGDRAYELDERISVRPLSEVRDVTALVSRQERFHNL